MTSCQKGRWHNSNSSELSQFYRDAKPSYPLHLCGLWELNLSRPQVVHLQNGNDSNNMASQGGEFIDKRAGHLQNVPLPSPTGNCVTLSQTTPPPCTYTETELCTDRCFSHILPLKSHSDLCGLGANQCLCFIQKETKSPRIFSPGK